MSTLTVVTAIRATIQRAPLRLSPLLRWAIATAAPRADGQPNLLPGTIPHCCAHDLFRCRRRVAWRVGDGRNRVYFCAECVERYWEAGHDVSEHEVTRWVS